MIANKAAESIKAYLDEYLDDAEIEASVYAQKSEEDKASPYVVVQVTSAQEDPPFTGNYIVEIECGIRTNSQSGKTDSTTLEQAIFNSLAIDDLAAQLTVSGFHVFGAFGVRPEFNPEGQLWTDSVNFTLYCCPSTLSA